MPLAVLRYEPTPNPHAIKCVLSGRVSQDSRPFRAAPSRDAEPLAADLFGVPGVIGLLLCGDWMTVNKDPKAGWPEVKSGVEAALARHG